MLQQDQVDSVEYYALQATEHVGSGGTQLLKGTVSRTKARKVSSATLPTVVPVPTAVYHNRRLPVAEEARPHRVSGGRLRHRAARARTHVTQARHCPPLPATAPLRTTTKH